MSPLPPPKSKTPPQSRAGRVVDTVVDGVKGFTSSKPKRPLPEDPRELDEATAKYKVMTRPIVTGVSKVYEILGAEALDKDEREGGVEALACLFYQEQAELDARFLFLMWLGATGTPRIHQMWEARKKKVAETSPGNVRIEREVRGERLTPVPSPKQGA